LTGGADGVGEDGIGGEPDQSHCHEDAGQHHRTQRGRGTRSDELRDQAGEEDGDLGVEQVADETLLKGEPAWKVGGDVRDQARGMAGAAGTAQREQRPEPEEDQVGRPGQLHDGEGKRRSRQQRRDAQERGPRPDQQPRFDAERGQQRRLAPVDEHVPGHQRHVGTGRDDHQPGHEHEGEEGRDQHGRPSVK
jgi:hypothetical protein